MQNYLVSVKCGLLYVCLSTEVAYVTTSAVGPYKASVTQVSDMANGPLFSLSTGVYQKQNILDAKYQIHKKARGLKRADISDKVSLQREILL